MPAYLVTLASHNGKTFRNGANAMAVFAASGTIAKQLAAAQFDGDTAAWNSADATATELAVAADWAGWTFRVTILSTPVIGPFEVVADATTNTIDEVGAALVTAINAHADIAGAAYNSTTQVLKVAETTDNQGDNQLLVEIIPPSGYASVDGLYSTVVDGGAEADLLSVTLPADAAVIPKFWAALAAAD